MPSPSSSADASFDHRKLPGIFQPQRKLKVLGIGAGASGLLLAYKIQRHFDDFELEIFEKNPEVSGTWYENRYPGCACDVPAHTYTWSFEPKTDWSANYASSKEIFQYFNDFATNSGPVGGASKGSTLNTTATHFCHVLVNAGGILNAWRYPPIKGIKEYKGTLVHSAAWPENLDLSGKVVGLIGNGSSGIQILPVIKKQVKKLVTFIREPTWVSPPLGQDYATFTEDEKARFKNDPAYHLKMRKESEAMINGNFAIFHAGDSSQAGIRSYMQGQMEQKLQSKDLKKLLIPQWAVGCRRLTPGTNYLESLSDENIEVVYGEITEITDYGLICDDGSGEHKVDVLICATGFDTTFKPRFPLRGKTNELLNEVWKDGPEAYFGISVPNYPNYFFTLGPNCPIGNGPVLIAIEYEVDYIIQMLSKFQKENIRSFDVKPEPVKDFNIWKDNFMKDTVWNEECRSWYKAGSADGKVMALWPGSTLHYLEALKTPRYEDWDWKTTGNNRFQYFGNGHSSAESMGTDLSYYLRNTDDTPIDPILKKSALSKSQNSRVEVSGSNGVNGKIGISLMNRNQVDVGPNPEK